jgi:hypothetical protein
MGFSHLVDWLLWLLWLLTFLLCWVVLVGFRRGRVTSCRWGRLACLRFAGSDWWVVVLWWCGSKMCISRVVSVL